MRGKFLRLIREAYISKHSLLLSLKPSEKFVVVVVVLVGGGGGVGGWWWMVESDFSVKL